MSRTVIAFVSDVHAGSTVAVCPPEVALDDGGFYRSSRGQLWLWQCWGDFWDRVAQVRDKLNAPLYTVFNGDLVEGNHHGTTQILSGNPTAQAEVLNACMAVPLRLAPERMFFVRGTEAHVGKSAAFEERIALGLQKDGQPVEGDPDVGTASWWQLRLEENGLLIDVAHQGRTGTREHTRQNAANLYAHDILLKYVKRKQPPPQLCVRAHYHRWMDSGNAARVLRVIGLPCWQLGTTYVRQKMVDELADIGGLIVVVNEDGTYTDEQVNFEPDQGATWRKAE